MQYPDESSILYHSHHRLHMEDLPLWLDLAERQGGAILELGCGTGRILLPLATAGHRVLGLDRDAGMLAVLANNLTAFLSVKVDVIQADMAAIPLRAIFNLVIMPCNTFSTLLDDERRNVLGWISKHLAAGGVFAASLPNPHFLQSLPNKSDAEIEEVFFHPLDGEPVQVSSAWKRTQRYFNLTWHYDHLLEDGRVQRVSIQVRHNLLTVAEFLSEFSEAGLQVVGMYGDYDRSPYDGDAPNLILLATAPAF